MEYIIGIDGGGSKTEVAFFQKDDLHETAKLSYGPGSNPRSVGYERSAERIAAIVADGMKEHQIMPGSVSAVGAGIAGAGRLQEQEELTRRLRSLFLKLDISENSKIGVFSDSEAALQGALPPGSSRGMLIISGTGSNAVAVEEGTFFKSGGWGHLFGDEGSGYEIGREVLRRVAKERDGRAASSLLSQIVLEETGVSRPEELIDYYYQAEDQKREIAALAKPVLRHEHLPEVQEILKETVHELALHIHSLHNKMMHEDRDTPVFTAGAIFAHSSFVKEEFKTYIESNHLGRIRKAYSSPSSGAAKLTERRGV
ncbi:N-acetylglucosamine kinase [Salimicrobium flavidum]|uniref:BadF-type ATPase n=1 Tax=Salimicrobium flavidum TaxID=570947 RepID=A0A1N7ISC0_9BACI|nr:BadF/BadG/BcrA/BcrD ATPase family protein [Salimicrobium flavidum]SIS39982.1 BadF-type ATPase [Salimicrobium flavidum]